MFFIWQHPTEVDGHRAPLASLLNQLSLSADCCRAMHFVTICDSDDSSGSDSDMSSENGSVGDTNTADAASVPAVGIATAVSVPPAGSSRVRGLSGAAAKEHGRVLHSPVLRDAVNSSPPASSAGSGHGAAVQTSTAGTHCQHTCKYYHYHCHKNF